MASTSFFHFRQTPCAKFDAGAIHAHGPQFISKIIWKYSYGFSMPVFQQSPPARNPWSAGESAWPPGRFSREIMDANPWGRDFPGVVAGGRAGLALKPGAYEERQDAESHDE